MLWHLKLYLVLHNILWPGGSVPYNAKFELWHVTYVYKIYVRACTFFTKQCLIRLKSSPISCHGFCLVWVLIQAFALLIALIAWLHVPMKYGAELSIWEKQRHVLPFCLQHVKHCKIFVSICLPVNARCAVWQCGVGAEQSKAASGGSDGRQPSSAS